MDTATDKRRETELLLLLTTIFILSFLKRTRHVSLNIKRTGNILDHNELGSSVYRLFYLKMHGDFILLDFLVIFHDEENFATGWYDLIFKSN